MSDSDNKGGSGGASSIHCYVCNSRAGVSIRNSVHIFRDQIKFSHSERPLHEVIAELTGKPVEKDKASSIICKKCYKLFDEYDGLKARMDEIKKEIQQQFNKTVVSSENDPPQVPRPSETNIVSKQEPTSSVSSPLSVPLPIVIKKEFIPAIKQKKIPVISMKNVTKLPSNFVVINQQGKIAVQNVDLTDTKNVQTTKEQENVNTKTTLKSSPVITKSSAAVKETVKNVNITNNPTTLRQESHVIEDDDGTVDDDFDDEEIVGEEEGQEEGEVQDGGYEGVEALEELEEDRENFVISHMEILNDAGGMELEEGTILVEQEADGTIRLLRHAGDMYEGGFDEVEASDDNDMEDSTVQDEDTTASDQSKKKSKILKLKAQNKNVSTSIEEFPSFDQLVKLVDDQLFQCLLCEKKEKGDKVENKDEESEADGDTSTSEKAKTNEKDGNTAEGIKDGKSGNENEKMDVEGEEEKAKDVENAQEDESKNDGEDGFKGFFGSCKVMTQHMRVIHNITIHLCHVCGVVFSKKADLNQHLEKHDTDGPHISEYKCVSCDKVFDNLRAFRIHNRIQHRDVAQKQHVCQVCNRKFGSKKLLEEHNNMHIGVKPYTCVLCGKSFASKYTYQSHCKTHTVRPRPFSCAQCGKSFFTLQNKTQHEKTHLGIKDFVCNVCGKAFGTQHNLDVHGVVHTGYKPYQCWICKKSFARRAEIRDHERIHTGERPYACEICGATFSQRSNLQSHKRATHFDDKRYKCRNCDKSFKRRRLLEYHIKSSHTGERPHKCNVCEATFVYPEHFKKHTRIHSGEKPYTCEVCGKAFNSRDNRNAHRFIHSDKKPYECLDCGAGFMRKPLLYAHMQQQGHLNDTIIVNQPRINNDLEAKVDHLETYILEDGQEVIINNIKEENLSESQLEGKITLSSASAEDIFETEFVEDGSKLIVRTGGSIKHDPIISQGDNSLGKDSSEVETGEMVGVEEGETTIITGDMIDSQRIHIIHSQDDSDHNQALEIEDGSMRFFQIRLPNGENGWVALNNTQDDA